MRFIGRLHHEAGHVEQHNQIVAQMEIAANELPMGLARGRCAGAVAQLHMLGSRNELAVMWADRALFDARRIGDPWLEAQASLERASAFSPTVSGDDAERALLSARELARQVGDSVLECRALNNLLSVVAPHEAIGTWARSELSEASRRCGLTSSVAVYCRCVRGTQRWLAATCRRSGRRSPRLAVDAASTTPTTATCTSTSCSHSCGWRKVW